MMKGVWGYLFWLSVILLIRMPSAGAEVTSVHERARIALNAWDMQGASDILQEAAVTAPKHPKTLALAGRLRLLQGRYGEAIDLLVQAQAEGVERNFSHLLAMAQAVEATTYDYETYRTSGGHFEIRYESGVDSVMVVYMDEVLEKAWDALTVVFDHEPPAPVRVEVYPRADVLAAVSPLTVEEIKTSGTIALCKYNRLMITSPRDLVYGYPWAETLAHEFSHLLITQKSRNTVPIWLHEGLAKFYESFWQTAKRPKLGGYSESLLAKALQEDALVSFDAMSPSMAKLPTQEIATTAFAEVFTVIEFLNHRGGQDATIGLIEAMANGLSDREAVSLISGLSWPRFESAWRNHLKKKHSKNHGEVFDQRLLFRGQHTAADELASLRGKKGRKFVWLGDQMLIKERYKAATKEYQKAIEEVGDTTALIQSKLGEALLKLKRFDEAIKAMKRALPMNPNYMLLRLYLGEAYLHRGEFLDARNHLERAVLINPFDPDVHGALSKVYQGLELHELAERENSAHQLVGVR